MTSIRKPAQWVATAAIATVFAAAGSGIAQAEAPATIASAADQDALSTQILPGVQYSSSLSDGSVVIRTPFGTLTTRAGQVQIQDVTGTTIAGAPFDSVPPAAVTVSGSGASAAPPKTETSLAQVEAPVAEQAAKDPADRFNQAIAVVGGQFGLAMGVGSMIGGLSGLAIGCAAGAFTGGSLFIPVSAGTLSIPAALAGCAAGGALAGGIGTMIGGAVVGIPVGIAALIQMQQKLSTPIVSTAAPVPAA
ncbi:hypothetical protein ACIP5Y_47880 [Nocardia sp. NPDC088792]|uniref:hypothetical protein n=1 Tax=Nocardia sp. NPDC088792 TaxID=3364332 RepID=UPI0038062E37